MSKCRDYALNILTVCDRTEKEMRDKLKAKGFLEDEIEDTLNFLLEYAYINDAEYIKKYINDAVKIKKWGKNRIISELIKKGADRHTAEEMLDDLETDFGAVITETLKCRFKNTDLNNPKEKNRIFSYFLRRGHSTRDIAESMRRLSDDFVYDNFF